MTHTLKTWPEYFKAVAENKKSFEIRKDDRPFEVGDTIILHEYDPEKEAYTGQEEKRTITYILRDGQKMGVKAGFVILSIEPIENY